MFKWFWFNCFWINSNLTVVCSWWFNWQWDTTGPGNGLVQNRQANVWTNISQYAWHHMAWLGYNALIMELKHNGYLLTHTKCLFKCLFSLTKKQQSSALLAFFVNKNNLSVIGGFTWQGAINVGGISCHFAIKGYTVFGKVHGAYMGLTWGGQDPGVPHVGPMILAIWNAIKWQRAC